MSPMIQYTISKLFNVLFAKAYANRYKSITISKLCGTKIYMFSGVPIRKSLSAQPIQAIPSLNWAEKTPLQESQMARKLPISILQGKFWFLVTPLEPHYILQ